MPLQDFALERYFAKYEFSVRYLLCSSDCETISIKQLFDATGNTASLTEQLLNLRLGNDT